MNPNELDDLLEDRDHRKNIQRAKKKLADQQNSDKKPKSKE